MPLKKPIKTSISKKKKLQNNAIPVMSVSFNSTRGNKTGSWRTLKPVIDEKKCTKCAICWKFCPDAAIILGEKITIDYNFCKGCGICLEECPFKAIFWEEENR